MVSCTAFHEKALHGGSGVIYSYYLLSLADLVGIHAIPVVL